MREQAEKQKIEEHPWEPFLPKTSKILLLGTFPPQSNKWSMDFYYPNINNDMWRVFGLLYFNDRKHFINTEKRAFCKEKIVEFLTKTGVALGDTALKAIRTKGNAADAYLKIVKNIDLSAILDKLPQCKIIVTSGKVAADVVAAETKTEIPEIGKYVEVKICKRTYKHFRMPSTSRAYPRPIEEKAAFYQDMLKGAGVL